MTKLVSLPVHIPEVRDFSTISTHQRCPRKWFYQYHISRAPHGVNYPIQFGVGYHTFREVIERVWLGELKEEDPRVLSSLEVRRAVYSLAIEQALIGWEEPPVGHKKEFLTQQRLVESCDQAFDDWAEEKQSKRYEVLQTEQAFDLQLSEDRRYGGKFDQLLLWNNRLWVRDFKTTSRMGKNYKLNFDPNNQMTGYVWAAQELSGRPVEGVIIDVLYNTKTKGPEFHSFLTTRSGIHLEWWRQSMLSEMKEIDRHIEEDDFPMRTGACADYGGCFFRDACVKSSWPTLENWLKRNTVHSVWDFMNPEQEEGVVD